MRVVFFWKKYAHILRCSISAYSYLRTVAKCDGVSELIGVDGLSGGETERHATHAGLNTSSISSSSSSSRDADESADSVDTESAGVQRWIDSHGQFGAGLWL